MRKTELLHNLEILQASADNDDEVRGIYLLTIIDNLLDYIGDANIREAVEKIPLL